MSDNDKRTRLHHHYDKSRYLVRSRFDHQYEELSSNNGTFGSDSLG